jgi:hypothetical protein
MGNTRTVVIEGGIVLWDRAKNTAGAVLGERGGRERKGMSELHRSLRKGNQISLKNVHTREVKSKIG